MHQQSQGTSVISDTGSGNDGYSIEVDEITREQWHWQLTRFDDASLYQTWDYGSKRWGEENLSHLIVKKHGHIVCAAQSRIVKLPLLSAGMAYVRYGPMWKVRGSERNVMNLNRALYALIHEYAFRRGLFLRIRPWGFDEVDGVMRSAMNNAGFQLTKGLYRHKQQTVLLDLRPTEEELLQKLRKKWRWCLRDAEGRNLHIIEGFDHRLFELFRPVYAEMLRAKRFRPGSQLSDYERMQEVLPPDHRIRITICHNASIPVSGSVCSAIGETAIGLFAATGAEGRRCHAYYLLQWDEILWAKRLGCRFMDLGGINRLANPGVYHFKTGMGGSEETYLGVFDYCAAWFLRKLVLAIEGTLRGLARVKAILYAHS